jgi:SAM-dependent methyltransferase
VHAVWQLLTSDARERDLFASLDATLALPASPAGPPNRLRRVVRIADGDRVYYLKTFARTQAKNRVRFLWTRPRARDDAHRELRVTEALRAAGAGAPRPVAYGRRGAVSFYLCAALPGHAFASLLAAWRTDAAMARAVASFCGGLLRGGFHLPDLGPDHVFVEATAAGARCAVLDLHNGRVAAPGAAPPRVCVRVLRRFAKAARACAVPWTPALRFGARLLRCAGRGADLRSILRRLPPYETAARYAMPGKSAAYAERNPARAARELDLLSRVWPGRAGEVVLDLPCGAGRLLPFLRERGHAVVQADGAIAMLRQARAAGAGTAAAVVADAVATPFAAHSVDGIVLFRFLHHLPPDLAARAIAEACRVARRFVVVSFFHPCSVHELRRRLRAWRGGGRTRFARSLARLRGDFAAAGFDLHARAAELPFARDLWLASFVRR